jgi:hypothetical protein
MMIVMRIKLGVSLAVHERLKPMPLDGDKSYGSGSLLYGVGVTLLRLARG